MGLAATLAITGAAYLHPRSTVIRTAEVAAVQSGGLTQTRASADQQPVVLARTVEATKQIDGPVDLILWPEKRGQSGPYLAMETAEEIVSRTAIERQATVLPGWFFPVNDRTATVNFQTAVWPDGQTRDRYDKVRTVPFGEFVPLRPLIEKFSGEIPAADVIQGTAPPVLDTPVGKVGVAISWEGFFENRSRDAIENGAELLTNPTNGSSYWLTQVHTQQVASNQLRALEFDRWVVMAAPTGLSAIISPNGNVQQRSDIGTRDVLQATVEMRRGKTLGALVGFWPVVLYTLAAAVWSFTRKRPAPLGGVQSGSEGVAAQ
ncbi:MAG: apolipoprotein N-acyltransferase [Acidimicrobiales bacterium]